MCRTYKVSCGTRIRWTMSWGLTWPMGSRPWRKCAGPTTAISEWEPSLSGLTELVGPQSSGGGGPKRLLPIPTEPADPWITTEALLLDVEHPLNIILVQIFGFLAAGLQCTRLLLLGLVYCFEEWNNAGKTYLKLIPNHDSIHYPSFLCTETECADVSKNIQSDDQQININNWPKILFMARWKESQNYFYSFW